MQRAQGDGSTVERLQYRTWSPAGEDPAARGPHTTGGPFGFWLPVGECAVPAVQRFGEPSSTHPTDAGMAPQALGCGCRDRSNTAVGGEQAAGHGGADARDDAEHHLSLRGR